jgi:virginiamycin B lyase
LTWLLMTIIAITPVLWGQTFTFTEYVVPTPASGPWGITVGPDGAIWFTECQTGRKIGRLTTSGVFSEYALSDPEAMPLGITPGPDGAIWFMEGNMRQGKIGRITTDGFLTEYSLPGSLGGEHITAGPDGALWFTEGYENRIGRITTAGVITEYNVPTPGAYPLDITVGPDGALWFTEYLAAQLGRITTDGVITEYPILCRWCRPHDITAGRDGALWFTEAPVGDRIGRMTVQGVVTEYPLPSGGEPTGITTGPDGEIWFTENLGSRIGRITRDGVITEYTVPTPDSHPWAIITGPDGALWFTEWNSSKIGRYGHPDNTPPQTIPTRSVPSNANGWNNTDVTVFFNATDNPGGSGVRQVTFSLSGAQNSGQQTVIGSSALVSITAEGATTLTYFATDNAGNNEPPRTVIVKIDRIRPVATATMTPPPNPNGWNSTPVTATFTGSDDLSGIAGCSSAVVLSAEGSHPQVSGTCTDNAGNVSAPAFVNVNVDKTLPVISGIPAPGCSLWPPSGDLVQVAIVAAKDVLSGLAPGSFQVNGISNEPSDPAIPDIVVTPGDASGSFVVQLRSRRLGTGNGRVYTIIATAKDNAGNIATTSGTCVVRHDQAR